MSGLVRPSVVPLHRVGVGQLRHIPNGSADRGRESCSFALSYRNYTMDPRLVDFGSLARAPGRRMCRN